MFDMFCKTLNSENKSIFKGIFEKRKSYREILRMPSVSINSTSTIKRRRDELMQQYAEYLENEHLKIPDD